MSEDKLDFLDEESEEQTPIETATESESVASEPVAEPEEKGDIEAAPPAAEPEPKAIPVTALLDERDKRQAAQRKAEEYERQIQDMKRQLAELQAPKEQPDFYADPDAAFRAREQQWEQRMLADKLQTSKFLAEREHGAELVAEAYAYFDQHPDESQALLRHPSPFHAAVEHYKRQKFINEVQDPEEWKRQQLDALREQIAREAQAAVPPKPKLPPTSLATAPASGGEPKSPGNAFDSVFR